MQPRNSRPAWGAVLAGAVLIMLLAGCGGGQETGEGDPAVSSGEVPAVPTPEEAGVLIPPDPQRVVATVNGSEILARKVYEVAQTNKVRLLEQGAQFTPEADREILNSSLGLVILGELMIQQARSDGMTVETAAIDSQLEQIRAQFDSAQAYEDYLLKADLTEDDVREEAERRALMENYRQTVLADVTPVTEQDARQFYDANPDNFLDREQVRVAQILIRAARNDPAEARDRAQSIIEDVYQKARSGEDFAELAREYSQTPAAAKGGDLGFFTRGKMVPKFEEMAFSIPVGEISPVFETPFGFNIIKVLEKREPRPRPFDEVKPQLIFQLQQLREMQALEARLQELKQKSTIEVLDAEFKPQQPATPEAG